MFIIVVLYSELKLLKIINPRFFCQYPINDVTDFPASSSLTRASSVLSAPRLGEFVSELAQDLNYLSEQNTHEMRCSGFKIHPFSCWPQKLLSKNRAGWEGREEEKEERFCYLKCLNGLKELLSDSSLNGLNQRLHGYSSISKTCHAAFPSTDSAQFQWK